MSRLLCAAVTAVVFGACSSAAAPGADNVLHQVDKAKQVEKQVEERNAQFDESP